MHFRRHTIEHRRFWTIASLGVALAFPPRPASALDQTKDVSQYTRAVWGTREGLPQDSVVSLAQTKEGHLWVGTLGGLARYDGGGFVRFDRRNVSAMRRNEVPRLLGARDGSLFIGTYRGLIRLAAGAFSRLSDAEISALYQDDDGAVWIGADDQLLRWFDGRHAARPLPVVRGERVTAIHRDGRRRLWVGTDRAIYFSDGGPFVRLTHQRLPAMYVSAFAEAGDQTLWVATSAGLMEINGDIPTSIGAGRGLAPGPISALVRDRDGNMWLGSPRGLVRFHDGRFVAVGKESFPQDQILSLLEDREGSLWIGTRTGGLVQLTDRTLRTLTVGLLGHVRSVCEDRGGAVWMATSAGVQVERAGQTERLTTASGLASNDAVAVYPSASGGVWIGTNAGVQKWHEDRLGPVIAPEPRVKGLYEDSHGTLWIGSLGGTFARIEGGRHVVDDRLRQVRSFVQDRSGHLFIGHMEGLARRDGEKLTSMNASGFPQVGVRSFFPGDDALWIGTNGSGLVRFAAGRFLFIDEARGLADFIHAVVQDDDEHVWVANAHGLHRVDSRSLPRVDVVSFEMSDLGHPIIARHDSSPAAWKRRDGSLLFATDRGVVTVDPRKVKLNQRIPAVVIDRVIVNRQGTGAGPHGAYPPGPGLLEFHYAGLSFVQPHKVRHRYRLEGFDDVWVEAGARRIAYYTNVPAGRYLFRVQAANNDGLWNQQGASLAIVLAPYFHQTWWFAVACALVALGGGAWLYRARVWRLRSRYLAVLEERSRVARELHDTLLQGMAAVAWQLSAVREQLPASADGPRRQLDVADGMLTQALDETRRAVWNLREQAADRGDLGVALARVAQRLTGGKSVSCEVSVEGTPFNVAQGTQQELFRIAQEALTNALKHAAATRIIVRLVYADDALRLSVADDGQGFVASGSEDSSGAHFGLVGLRERAAGIGGTFSLRSAPGTGTEIIVAVPRARNEGHG